MEEEIDKQCQALRDELSDQGSQVTDEVKKFIRPQVEELEKKQQAETKAKLEQMQKANDEKVEVMKAMASTVEMRIIVDVGGVAVSACGFAFVTGMFCSWPAFR